MLKDIEMHIKEMSTEDALEQLERTFSYQDKPGICEVPSEIIGKLLNDYMAKKLVKKEEKPKESSEIEKIKKKVNNFNLLEAKRVKKKRAAKR